jgi:hypothetical protein
VIARRIRFGMAVAWGLALLGAPAAWAGTPGHWTQFTDATASNIDEVSLARTADGVLHAAWSRPTPSNPGSGRDLLDVPISPAGAVGAPGVIASNWATLENPSLVATGGQGLYLFEGGTRTTNADEPLANLALFASTDDGQSWTIYPSDLTKTGAAYGSNVAAALGSDGTPFETWGSSSCLCVHRGIQQSTPNYDFQQGLGDYGYEPGIALDPATGQLVVAWYSNGTGHDGVYAAVVNQATGELGGAQTQMDGTSTLLDGPFSGRTPIAARPGGGLYVAYEAGYPSHTKVLLWRVGSSTSQLIAQSPAEVRSVGLASSPDARLWAFWSARNAAGSPIVYVRRSNSEATDWGATVVVKPPAGAESSWNLVGNSQPDRLDLVGSFSLGTSSTAASWHTQVLPGLTLTASKTHLNTGPTAQKVTFSVLDAGTPLKGAHVHVGSASGTTNAKGKVRLALGPFAHRTHLAADASAPGYVGASTRISVK